MHKQLNNINCGLIEKGEIKMLKDGREQQNRNNALIDLARLREQKGILLKSSKVYFVPDEREDMDHELMNAIDVIKNRAKTLVFTTPTTKTTKGMGIMAIEYGIDDIWFSKDRLICHINVDAMARTVMLDKYGNEIQRNY
jgi:hypothetical protein